MIIKHWSFPLEDNKPSTKDEVTVDIYVNVVIALVTSIFKMTLWYFTCDQAALSGSYKAEMKLNGERLDNRTIKITKKKESFNLKGKGFLGNKQNVFITTVIDYIRNTSYMEKEEFECGIEIDKL